MYMDKAAKWPCRSSRGRQEAGSDYSANSSRFKKRSYKKRLPWQDEIYYFWMKTA